MNDKLLRAMADTCTDWFYGEPLPYPLNSTQQESGPAFSADGHYLFLARGEMRSGDGWSGGGSDLFMAYRAALNSDSTWSIPEPFGATINTPATETAPALSADNRTLYFASDRPGGLGGLDLWCSHFQNGRWQEAQNLGPGINSAGNETAPFLCADGQTLYFSSDGRLPTLGGYDLYRSRRSGEDWGAAEHLPAPFNGPGDELSCSTTPTGDTLYFATDRQGPVGNLDIWVGQLPPDMRPVAVQVVRAHVRDSLTGQLMPNALVEVVETATNQALGSFTSNRGDASLTLFLQPSVDYKLSISRSGYLPFESVWNTDSMAAGGSRSLALLPDTYVLPTWDSLLLRIHFQKNERSLSDSLREEVAFALAPWRGVTGAQILLWGFTDNSGMPLLNEELSALRAGLVGIVARQVGLEPNRITEQGWGEVSPMAPNDTEEGRYLNRRVEIILRRPVRGR
jgi:outer membrane protein OmpA-like peptidoglycan-associated protein